MGIYPHLALLSVTASRVSPAFHWPVFLPHTCPATSGVSVSQSLVPEIRKATAGVSDPQSPVPKIRNSMIGQFQLKHS